MDTTIDIFVWITTLRVIGNYQKQLLSHIWQGFFNAMLHITDKIEILPLQNLHCTSTTASLRKSRKWLNTLRLHKDSNSLLSIIKNSNELVKLGKLTSSAAVFTSFSYPYFHQFREVRKVKTMICQINIYKHIISCDRISSQCGSLYFWLESLANKVSINSWVLITRNN